MLFADLVGFTARAEPLDPEDVEAILRPYHERLRTELEQRGGTVEKFVGDAVMAVFGAPVAHEDDPERAVRAALAIRDGIAEDGELEVRVAVNTGEALVDRRRASGARARAMVAGDVVNTAARLQSAAPVNGILVGESTYRATRARDRVPRARAGRGEGQGRAGAGVGGRRGARRASASTARPGDAARRPRARARPAGRRARPRPRASASPQLVTLVGVPGIGKSRLVRELYDELEREPELIALAAGPLAAVRRGRDASGRSARWSRRRPGILESDDAAERRAQAARAASRSSRPRTSRWVEAHLRPLVGLERRPSAAATRDESFAAWRRFFEALAERAAARPRLRGPALGRRRPARLRRPARRLGRAACRCSSSCTARPELLERRPGWGGGKRERADDLALAARRRRHGTAARRLLDEPLLPAREQQALLARAGGNPLYAEEFARMLARARRRRRRAARDRAGDHRRAARLAPAGGEGAAPGRGRPREVFWPARCARRRRRREERAARARSARSSSAASAAASVAGETRVRVRAPARPRRRVRRRSRGPARAEKHVRAARWIESLGRRRGPRRAARAPLPRGARARASRPAGETAELVEPALDALLTAARRAQSSFAFSQAERYAARALELWPRSDRASGPPPFCARPGRGRARKPGFGERAAADGARRSLRSATSSRRRGRRRSPRHGCGTSASATRRTRRRSARSQLVRGRGALVREARRARGARAPADAQRRVQRGGRSVANAGLAAGRGARRGRDRGEPADHARHGSQRARRGRARRARGGIAIVDRLNIPREFTRGHNNLAEQFVVDGDLAEAERALRNRARADGAPRNHAERRVAAAAARGARLLPRRLEQATSCSSGMRACSESMPGHYLDVQVGGLRARMAIALGRGDDRGASCGKRRLDSGRTVKDPQALVPDALRLRAVPARARSTDEEAVALLDEMNELSEYFAALDRPRLGRRTSSIGATRCGPRLAAACWADAGRR